MNKTAIKNFAIWARRKLISDITYKAGTLGITDSGIAEPLPISTNDLQFFDIGTKDYAEVSGNEIAQRKALADAIKAKEKGSKTYKEAFDYIVEEVAYTWFNRLIAIRFMEVNDYLPSGIRVLSSENVAKNEPDFVTMPFDTDLEFTPFEQDRVIQLKDENKLDELFRMLFIKQCNKLHEILPDLFEKTDDYTELLLTISFTDKDGVVSHLVHDIDEDDFNIEKEGQVEIIGWLYQYYNTEPKDTVFANLKKNVKISKDNIPAATQLFTPDWIVRYMVENSLGRIFISEKCSVGSERLSETERIEKEKKIASEMCWKYYLPEAEQTPEVRTQLNALNTDHFPLNTIKLIDPCMGSGHILVYAFDVLMQIYETCGYTQRDAAQVIVKNNIFGVDIDFRAYQLAYFAIMMKGRQYDRRFFSRQITPNLSYSTPVYYSPKANILGDEFASYLDHCTLAEEAGLGALRNSDYYTAENIDNTLKSFDAFQYDMFDRDDMVMMCQTAAKSLKLIDILSQKYDVVVTNPPYMGAGGMNPILSKYVKYNYPDSKSDLFAVFIERCTQMAKDNGYVAMITQHSWMFLSSFEKLRTKLLENASVINMAHLGARAFEEIGGEVVQTTSWVHRKNKIDGYNATYKRLVDFNSQQSKEKAFLNDENVTKYAVKENFSKIPGSPVAYWVSDRVINAFTFCQPLVDIAKPCVGLQTSNNERFIRLWHEVEHSKMRFGVSSGEETKISGGKWFPHNKGGEFRKWYGNNYNVVDYENDGFNIKSEKAKNLQLGLIEKKNSQCWNSEYYFRESLTWSRISSSNFGIRYSPQGFVFDTAGTCIFADTRTLKYLLGFLSTKVVASLLQMINPTLTFQTGDIAKIPVRKEHELDVVELVDSSISFSKGDWDSFETSWDFRKHPLVRCASFSMEEMAEDKRHHIVDMNYIEDAFVRWSNECYFRFNDLKANEEKLNRIFIDIYGLQDELTPDVEDKDVTVRKADLQRDIKSLLSYAVGCMFGRYSLDTDGLVYAGGEWDNSKFETFIPDADNCIPITDEEYFEDDIVGLLCVWLKKVYGEKTLEENLDFIANALGNKGNTSREIIRNYFLNDFIKDHIKIYQKRPIYWLFDSGKQNGFKALVYMHRWNADTIGNMRVEYLHRMQRVYDKEIERMQEVIDNSHENKEIAAANKRKEKLQKQIKETKDYDAKIAHLALSRIDIDLDDGVKVNYEKVQTAPDGKKMQILAKI